MRLLGRLELGVILHADVEIVSGTSTVSTICPLVGAAAYDQAAVRQKLAVVVVELITVTMALLNFRFAVSAEHLRAFENGRDMLRRSAALLTSPSPNGRKSMTLLGESVEFAGIGQRKPGCVAGQGNDGDRIPRDAEAGGGLRVRV